MIDIDALPQLRDPVLVVALSGWVDAGLAGGGTVAVLEEQLESVRTFGRLDLSDLMDLQQTRPTVHLVDEEGIGLPDQAGCGGEPHRVQAGGGAGGGGVGGHGLERSLG